MNVLKGQSRTPRRERPARPGEVLRCKQQPAVPRSFPDRPGGVRFLAMADSLETLAARCLTVGIQGLEAAPEALELVRRGVGGVILFARNVQDPEQVAGLSRALKQAAPGPLVLSIDQEGGRVQRLRGPAWTELPSMRRMGELPGAEAEALCREAGALLARELSACGLDLDYAPVVDIDTNPANPVIADRSFSRDAQRVARLGVALGQGLEESGVASCVKHFPGHGDTAQDSHLTLPRLPHGLERLHDVELVPFAAAAHAGLASVMTAHVVFEAFDSLPATLSPKALRLLRDQVGFQGCCISDDLEMKAIADTVGVVDAAVRAVAAGVDCLLVCHTLALQHAAIDALVAAVRSGTLSHDRLAEAAGRVARLQRFARPASAVDPARAAAACGTSDHRALAQRFNRGQPIAQSGVDPTEWRKA